MDNLKKSRVETLDWLRGLMALSIMFYHLIYWIFNPLDASNPLGRLGIYGVSIFFILSGLSMAIVYNTYIDSILKSIIFYIRRIFRIWPLLWVICFVLVIPILLKTGTFDWKLLFLNLTTLFGFLKPTAYIPTGAWSIGNEMVYYALTPLILFLYNTKKWFGNVFFVFTLIIGLFFSFYLLKSNLDLPAQWPTYVNPFNNLFLYVMGIALFYNFKETNISTKLNLSLLIIAVILFCILPFSGNQISIVTGIGRIVFSILSFIIVFCFYKLNINVPKTFGNILETFGIATYGIYLIHPVVYLYTGSLLEKINSKNNFLLLGTTVVLTILISIFSYNFFELPMIKIGKKFTNSFESFFQKQKVKPQKI
ncbi:acyltransferase [Flavobacterium cupreum]|uniref:Acyltransferase n=2 Tax=Flavobacterium TaxID=237 RepID=A0A434A5U5_9FLAO|nr:acyltransferase [Flavobacterium cupreum]RUT69674.1 acyltransferase [Flavobacterium cupreum]